MDKTQLEAIVKAAVEQALAAAQTETLEKLPFDDEPTKPTRQWNRPKHDWTHEEEAVIRFGHLKGHQDKDILAFLKIDVSESAVCNRKNKMKAEGRL